MFPLSNLVDSLPPVNWFTLIVLSLSCLLLFRIRSLASLKNYILTRIRIRRFFKTQKRKCVLDADLRRKDLSAVEVGLLPSPSQYELDNPSGQILKHCDGIHFMGVNSDSCMMDVCIDRIQEDVALVWVYLKLSDGQIYTLPSTDTRRAYIANENRFASSGLQIKCLSPLRKWRINFNGLLKKCQSGTEGKDDELLHVKFSFIWLAMSMVQEHNFSYSEGDLARAFLRENHPVEEKDLVRLQKLQNRYEQWGQLMGTINLQEEAEKEFYFWSMRTRIADTPLWNEKITCSKFYMYFEEGIPLKVENLSIENFMSNLQSGFSITPCGAVRGISNCDLNLNPLTMDKNEIKFSFNINEKTNYLQLEWMEERTTFRIGPELQLEVTLCPFKVRMNDSDKGYGILHHLSVSNDGTQAFQFPPVLLKDPGNIWSEKPILMLEDEMCRSSNISGGKGSSLALLSNLSKETNEFIVPRGFVISTAAFRNHLQSNDNLLNAVQKLKDIACGTLEGDLKTECNRCASVFASTALSRSLEEEIEETLQGACSSLEHVKFSVRSSAFGEDGEDLSAAGQMLTTLGVKGTDNIFKAVVQCWASRFGFEAVQYARQNGQSILSPMAVVIQEMVPSDFSGVLFTVDPVTGDPTHPYITANFGLGETVVSALADPDTIVLKRREDQSLQVLKTHCGTKKTQVFLKTGNGVETKISEEQSESLCLTPEWATKIGEAGVLIESCFCSPRDIEWAVHKDQLYLLQARPITTQHNETDFELIHDQDTPVKSVREFWTRANTGEVFLGATSPLGISLVVGGMDLNAHKGHITREKRFTEFCPFFFHILPVTHRQVAINLIDMLFKHNTKEMSAVQKAFEAALFGRGGVLTDEILQAGIRKYGLASTRHKVFGLLFIPMLAYAMPKSIDKISKELSEHKPPLETFTTAKKAFDGILNQMNFYMQMNEVHGMTTFLSTYFNMILMTTLSKRKKEWDAELYCDFATLLSSCSDVESANVPESLQELAQCLASSEGKAFSSLSVDVAFGMLKDDSKEYGKLFEKFIERHGHRCVKEFDLYSKSWGMQPKSLIPTLQNMVRTLKVQHHSPKEVPSTEAILSKVKTPLSSFSKKLLKILLPYSRKYVGQREKTKSMTIKTVDWLRMSCYRLGDLMVREGVLPDAELVFFLTLEEIKDVLDSQKPGLVPKAVRRKRLHATLNELKFPEIMKGIPTPVQLQEDYSSYASSFTLKGTPVCQGRVKGRAVVVIALEEASKIENGDILITHATDIGWSPYFPLLSGVVTVLGGLISHGAVVAREFGLPCVVGVENATMAFQSGDIVILNGTKGTVTKVLAED